MEWLPQGHVVYFILDVVEQLDLSAFAAAMQEQDPRGTRPYSPQMMVALLLYGYAVGVFSSRKLERATYESVPFRVLAGGEHPHFTTINGFRKRHLGRLEELFVQVLRMCRRAGMVRLGHVALDGTKVQGNASKHKAMSHGRMSEEERRLAEEVERLRARVGSLFEQAEEADACEDAELGEGQREEDLPEELRRHESRLARIREAKAELEAEAAQARARALRAQAARAEQSAANHPDPVERKRAATRARSRRERAQELDPGGDDDDTAPPVTRAGLPRHEPKAQANGTPQPRAQRSFTDPDSRLMERGGSYLQGYNCQAAVDEGHQVIVAQAVTNQSTDNGNLVPMLEQVRASCGEYPERTSADAGYWSAEAVTQCEQQGSDVYVSTARGEPQASEFSASRTSSAASAVRAQMQRKLASPVGRATYRRPKAVVEPVFGQVKEARGFRRFLLRGLSSVQSEWSLVCTGHNLLKLFGYQRLASA
jgi:transposase